jgi:cytochrome c-type biogenesis protein CcmH
MLKAQQEAGELTAEEVEQQQRELERRLLDENAAAQSASVASESAGLDKSFLAAALLLVCAGAWYVYQDIGGGLQMEVTDLYQQLADEQALALAEDRNPDLEIAMALADKLEILLERDPEDLNNTYLLASAYAQLLRFENAVPLYKKYLMARPTDERVLTEYTQILYLANERQLTERVKFVVDRALELNPHNQQVLAMMAMHHFQAGDYRSAIGHWQNMLAVLRPDSPTAMMVQEAVTEAQKRLSSEKQVDKPVDNPVEKSGDKINH